MRIPARTFLAAGVTAALVSLASPASAQVEPLTRFLGGILGFNTDDGEQIEYRERAPLVVPPNAGQLRSPAQGNAAERRGNWPRDPDVAARQRAAADRSRPIVLPTDRELQRPMTLEEIRQGRVAGAELPRNPQGMVRDQDLANEIGGVAALREMDSRSAIRRDEELQPGVEPRRAFLTDPPSGLRMPAGNRPIVVTRDAGGDRRPEGSPYDIYREGPNSR